MRRILRYNDCSSKAYLKESYGELFLKTIKRNPASTVVWLVVLFLFIASSGCALLKQPENEIVQSNFVPLSNFDREWHYGQLPESDKPPSTESKKSLKSLHSKLLEKKWLNIGFCLTTQYIVSLLPGTRYRYICGVGAINKKSYRYISRLKVTF